MARLPVDGGAVVSMSAVMTPDVDVRAPADAMPWRLIEDPLSFPWERTRGAADIALVDLRDTASRADVDLMRNWMLPTDFVLLDRRDQRELLMPCGHVWGGPDWNLEMAAQAVESRLLPGQRQNALETVELAPSVNRFIVDCVERLPPSPLVAAGNLWFGHPGVVDGRDDIDWYVCNQRLPHDLSQPATTRADSGGTTSSSTNPMVEVPPMVAPVWGFDDRGTVLRPTETRDPQLLRSESFNFVHSITRRLPNEGSWRQDWLANLHRLVRVGGVLALTWQKLMGRETFDNLVADLLDATYGQVVMGNMTIHEIGEQWWEPWTSVAVRRIGPSVWL